MYITLNIKDIVMKIAPLNINVSNLSLFLKPTTKRNNPNIIIEIIGSRIHLKVKSNLYNSYSEMENGEK